jgi:ankyrin repeat protein
VEDLEILLASGSDVDAVDEKGMTALHVTAANGHMVEKCQREREHMDTGSGD